ncbi:MAG: protease pro-enzyme activation domain-containing protein, partial [Chloroflexota bacterium]
SPSQARVDAVTSFLRSQGLTVVDVSPNHLFVEASGTIGQVEGAFDVQIDDFSYRGRAVHAPVVEPSIPSALSGEIAGIGGLDDVAVLSHGPIRPVGPAFGQVQPAAGSGPGGGYAPDDLRAAYDLNPLIDGMGDDGAGQTIALVEFDGFSSNDVATYLSAFSLGSPNWQVIPVDGGVGAPGDGSIEVELDMEVASAIAPGASQIVYEAPNTWPDSVLLYNQIVTDDHASVVSSSWGACEGEYPSSVEQQLDQVLQEGAAQGQAFFVASGDDGAYGCQKSTTLQVQFPASDPNVVAVGGTSLVTGSGGIYESESAWSCALCAESNDPAGIGGGGGFSSTFSMPSFQVQYGLGTSASKRNVPDVSANADPSTGYTMYCATVACGSAGWIIVGGTSAATPLWAGLAADTNEYLHRLGKTRLGNASAFIYGVASPSEPYTAYHDVRTGDNLHYNAGPGYDLATGLGSPDAWSFARDVAVSSPTSLSGGLIDFGLVAIGSTSTGESVIFTNGLSQAVTLPTVTVGGETPGAFSHSTNCDGAVVPSGGSCAVTVAFTPNGLGAESAELSFYANVSSTLLGTGVTQSPPASPTPPPSDSYPAPSPIPTSPSGYRIFLPMVASTN